MDAPSWFVETFADACEGSLAVTRWATDEASVLEAEWTLETFDFALVICDGRSVTRLAAVDEFMRENSVSWAPLALEVDHLRLGPFFEPGGTSPCYSCYVLRRRSAPDAVVAFDMPQAEPPRGVPALIADDASAAGAMWAFARGADSPPWGEYVQVSRSTRELDRGVLIPTSACAQCGRPRL